MELWSPSGMGLVGEQQKTQQLNNGAHVGLVSDWPMVSESREILLTQILAGVLRIWHFIHIRSRMCIFFMQFAWISSSDLLRQLLPCQGFRSRKMIISSKFNILEKYLEHVDISPKRVRYFQSWTRFYSRNFYHYQDLRYRGGCWPLLLAPPPPKDCTDLNKRSLPAQHENQLQLMVKDREMEGSKKKGEEEKEEGGERKNYKWNSWMKTHRGKKSQ